MTNQEPTYGQKGKFIFDHDFPNEQQAKKVSSSGAYTMLSTEIKFKNIECAYEEEFSLDI